jgi:histidinol dehydrogenase
MMRRVDLRGLMADGQRLDVAALLPRAGLDVDTATELVRPLVEAVRRDGERELIRQAAAYDGVTLQRVRVPGQALSRAAERLDDRVRRSLDESVNRLRLTCAAELPDDVETWLPGGGHVVCRNVPVGRVGLYVPAATAPLVSSVLMNVVPAQVAGVSSIALASPAQRENDGLPHPNILAACALLGVDEVYAAGGAGAVAMFAYGYRDADDPVMGCRPVDLVTGPANVYGVAAKRLVRGVVGIDSEAGPTEIAVLADDSADARYVAADLVSQAEHDTLAASVLVTPSSQLADAVDDELRRQVDGAKHAERIRAALGGQQSAIVLVDDLAHGVEVVNAYAAEHLEIQTRDAATLATRVRNAGAVFVGAHAPVSLGDYCAGSNHVLPTGGGACRSSGLSVRTFLKTMQVVDYSVSALAATADHVVTLAHAEDLPAHAEAVRVRLEST